MSTRARQTWWRRERVALVLLPVVLIAALAATSSRIHDYYWLKGFHDRAPVSSSGVAAVDIQYDDGFLTYPIRAGIALESARPVTELPGAYAPLKAPTGARVWQVILRWAAEPDVSLTGCTVALVDDDGNRYDASISAFEPRATPPVQVCVPDDTPGPKPQVGSRKPPAVAPGERPRPRTYTTTAYVVVPHDVRPKVVRVWWFLPTYAELPIG